MRISDWSSDVCSSDLLTSVRSGLMPLSQQSAHGGHKSQRLIEHQWMACSRNSDYLDVFSAKIVHEIPRVTCEQQAFLAMDDRLAAWRRHKFRADCKPIGARIVALENCG